MYTVGIQDACLQFVYFGLGLWGANIMNSIGIRNGGKFIILFLCIICTNFSTYLPSFISIHFAVYRLMKELKQACFASALNRDCTYFDFSSTGKVTHILHTQTNVVIDFMSDKLPILIELVGTVIAGLAISFYYAWNVTLVSLSCAPAIIAIVYTTTKFSLRATSRSNATLQRASEFAKEVLSNIRTVFSFDAGQRSSEKYHKKLEPALKTGTTAALMNGWQLGATTFCAFAALPLVLWYGGLCISRGSYNGTKSVFNGYLLECLASAKTRTVGPPAAIGCFYSSVLKSNDILFYNPF